MATYYIDATVTQDLENNTLLCVISGTGVGSPKLVSPGDTVGFRYASQPAGVTTSVSLLSTDHWTSTSIITLTSSYQYKTVKTGVPTSVEDVVKWVASKTNFSNSPDVTTTFMGLSLAPDITVTLDETTYDITSVATSHTIVITDTGSSTNGTITDYRVKDSTTTHESRTGYGSLVVTDVPANDGFPKTYTLEARITTANAGSGLWAGVVNYNVIATTAATSNDPTLSSYGFAIYDHNGAAITSFNEGHSTLRDLFTSSVTTLSTTGTTDIYIIISV